MKGKTFPLAIPPTGRVPSVRRRCDSPSRDPRSAVMIGLSPRRFLAVALVLGFASVARADGKVDFNRDVRPILSDKCFACHGPDTTKLKGKLRLDDRAAALKRGAFVPGKPDDSAVVHRIFSADPDEVMPP